MEQLLPRTKGSTCMRWSSPFVGAAAHLIEHPRNRVLRCAQHGKFGDMGITGAIACCFLTVAIVAAILFWVIRNRRGPKQRPPPSLEAEACREPCLREVWPRINRHATKQFVKQLHDQGLADSRITSILSLLGMLLREAVADKRIGYNPCHNI